MTPLPDELLPWLEPGHRADSDLSHAWSQSGAQWLTDRGVAVPRRLVDRVLALFDFLDARGWSMGRDAPGRGVGVLSQRAALTGLGPARGRVSCGGSTRFVQAADGWIAVNLARPEDLGAIPAWLEMTAPQGDPWREVASVCAARLVRDLVERAGLLGIACATLGETTDGRPVILETAGHARARPVDGLVVVNLGSLWAAPLAGHALSALGARVIKVESRQRPDGARATPRFFGALNSSSEHVTLDLAELEGRRRLKELIGHADVVIEASRPRAMEQMGIHATEMTASGPQIWVSITGHGRSTLHRERVGFGDDTAAAGGLVGWNGGEPRFIADAVADPLTGLTAAATICSLAAAGGRWIADIALSRVARSVAAHDPSDLLTPRPDATSPRIALDPPTPPLGLEDSTEAVLASFGVQ